MLEKVRERCGHLTSWLRPEIKKAMYVHWETDKCFRHRHLTNRANRTSDRLSKYTDDSTTFMETKARLQSGEDVSGSATSVVDPNAVWHETASASYKNRVYGLGLFFANSLCTSTMRPWSTSITSRVVDPEERIDLRLQVQELTQSLHEQAQELNETRERYQKILTCVTNTNKLRLE
ncbi:uncharacterized protein DS421_11g332650 [Arachis hypogaea]|nr:uncharacterized protein DS421_11g332650 [Arachis hypogaea]